MVGKAMDLSFPAIVLVKCDELETASFLFPEVSEILLGGGSSGLL